MAMQAALSGKRRMNRNRHNTAYLLALALLSLVLVYLLMSELTAASGDPFSEPATEQTPVRVDQIGSPVLLDFFGAGRGRCQSGSSQRDAVGDWDDDLLRHLCESNFDD